MNARKTFPHLAGMQEPPEPHSYIDSLRVNQVHEAGKALDEIDNLRRWKAEAMEALAEWDKVADLFPPRLGASKPRVVMDEIARLRSIAAAVETAVPYVYESESGAKHDRCLIDTGRGQADAGSIGHVIDFLRAVGKNP